MADCRVSEGMCKGGAGTENIPQPSRWNEMEVVNWWPGWIGKMGVGWGISSLEWEPGKQGEKNMAARKLWPGVGGGTKRRVGRGRERKKKKEQKESGDLEWEEEQSGELEARGGKKWPARDGGLEE